MLVQVQAQGAARGRLPLHLPGLLPRLGLHAPLLLRPHACRSVSKHSSDHIRRARPRATSNPHRPCNHLPATMLAAHSDQENLAAAHQQAATGKPLNAGTRAFAAKTPANKPPKTPFKVALNDENVTTRAGKVFGKGPENQLLPTGKKAGKADSNAFVTPAGGSQQSPTISRGAG